MFENINQINQSACCRDIENGQTLDDDHLKISKYWKVSTKYWNVPVNKEYKIVCCNVIGSFPDISNILMNWLTNQLTNLLRSEEPYWTKRTSSIFIIIRRGPGTWGGKAAVILSCNNIDIPALEVEEERR